MNKIYKNFYNERLFTIAEANKIIKNYQVCKNTLQRLHKKDLIRKIKNGLYYIVPIDHPDFYPDPIHIASKLRNSDTPSIIGCNTALSVLKCLPKEEIVYLFAINPSKRRIKDIVFRTFRQKTKLGIIEAEYLTPYNKIIIQSTDPEKTIIDCLWNKTIKIEQLINALKYGKSLGLTITASRTINYLEKLKKPILFHKIGFVLDTIKDYFNILEGDLEPIRKKLSKKTFYFRDKGLRLTRPRYIFNNKWRIMIPEHSHNAIFPKTNA